MNYKIIDVLLFMLTIVIDVIRNRGPFASFGFLLGFFLARLILR